MPTAELRTGAQKSDVFRTVNGVNFKISPFDSFRGGEQTHVVQEPLMNITPACYPRIVLKDTLGYELDTYTTLQEAIYRAKWNVQTTGQAKTPIEWRLPKAPTPARPDLTRTFPPVKHPQLSTGHRKAHAFSSNVLEIDVDDVSFVRESLDNLPHVPSLSFLRQEHLVGPKTYFQIVGTMLLHRKLLSETEKRQAIYKFPGFCSGCIRMGLCYGCDRSTEPHYHEDKPVKTGGGFTYYKKDRPEREMKYKNPINWKINHPDQVLKKLMEDYAGVHLEGDISEKIKDHLDEHGGESQLNVSENDSLYRDRRKKRDQGGDDGRFLPDINANYNRNGYQQESGSRKGQRSGHSGDISIDPSDVDIEMYETENGRMIPLSKRSTKSDLVGGGSETDQSGYLQADGDQLSRDDSRGRYNDFERYEHRLPKYRKTETDGEMEDGEDKKDYDGDDESRGRKRDRLYKPPAPFKLKKSPKRRIESKSPFSTERSYDIKKGRDFVPKKSEKRPTEFVDFRNVDVSWKEPKKFELKNASHKPTKFWSGQRNKKKDKSRSRSPKPRRRNRPARSPSPDSGLDTGFVTEHTQANVKPNVKRIDKESKKGLGKEVKRPKSIIKKAKQQENSCTSPGYRNPIDDLGDTATEFYKLTASDEEITGGLKRSRVGGTPKGTALNGGHSNEAKGVDTNNDDNGNYSASFRKRVTGRDRSMSIGVMEEDGTNKSELEPLREESQVIEPPETTVMERVLTPSLTTIPTPASNSSLLSNSNLNNTNSSHNNRITNPLSTVGEGHIQKLQDDGSRLFNTSLHAIQDEKPKTPVKREIVKKEKKVKTPLPPRPKPITPEPREPTPTPVSPEPIEYEEPVSREISFDFVREPPELPPIEVPDLPDIPELQPTEYKGIKREKKLIEVTPELTEPKRKLPPPPKSRPQIRSRAPSRKQKVAEAPVTTQELQQMQDPLDFLAKYCIINPDRLPFYERVFNGALSVQTPRYSRATEAPKGAIVHLPPAQLSDHELNMLKDITVLNQGHCPRNDGISGPEQYLEKLNYSIEFIKSKQDVIQSHMEKQQAEKMRFMAGLATKWDRDIVRLDYKTKGKKKKKKKKKKKGDDVDYDQMGSLTTDKINFQPMKSSDITDEVIVSRMDDKMMKKIKKDPSYLKYKMEIGRDIEKLKHYDQRVAQIEDEKDLVGLYCMDYYFSEQGAASRPHEFRRQQSRLYQKLHPDTDIEMNIEEVEPALQQINNKLLTEREFQYIYFILELPKREKINFRLFSIIAALSEKVTQMDPVIRKLINKVDYNALDVKMEKSKELFQLLQDERVLPKGNAPSDNLAVELTAGGLTPEHTNYVMNKFDRDGRGFIDFLDFVTYVPLFIDIHRRIIEDPFNETLCV